MLLCPRVKARTSEAKARASEAKAKDLTFEAKAEDLTSEAKAKDTLTWPRGQGRGLEDYISAFGSHSLVEHSNCGGSPWSHSVFSAV